MSRKQSRGSLGRKMPASGRLSERRPDSPHIPADLWRRVDRAGDLYRASTVDRVQIVKRGLPARYTTVLANGMYISKEKLYTTVGLARATVDRKVRADQRLNQDESERVMGIARLVGQAQSMVEESGGGADFDAAKWLAEWLDRPLPALGGKRPAEFMDTAEGRTLVSDLLAQQQSGAYA
jgi:putative toxin-antitoxin system antitoxin component (TIGR02293 family)